MYCQNEYLRFLNASYKYCFRVICNNFYTTISVFLKNEQEKNKEISSSLWIYQTFIVISTFYQFLKSTASKPVSLTLLNILDHP